MRETLLYDPEVFNHEKFFQRKRVQKTCLKNILSQLRELGYYYSYSTQEQRSAWNIRRIDVVSRNKDEKRAHQLAPEAAEKDDDIHFLVTVEIMPKK